MNMEMSLSREIYDRWKVAAEIFFSKMSPTLTRSSPNQFYIFIRRKMYVRRRKSQVAWRRNFNGRNAVICRDYFRKKKINNLIRRLWNLSVFDDTGRPFTINRSKLF